MALSLFCYKIYVINPADKQLFIGVIKKIIFSNNKQDVKGTIDRLDGKQEIDNINDNKTIDLTQDVELNKGNTEFIDKEEPNNDLFSDNKMEIKKQTIERYRYEALVKELLPKAVHIRGIYLDNTEQERKWLIVKTFGGDIVPSKKTKHTGGGSGFFISDDGYILTNYHVIEDAQDIDVETNDGTKYKGNVVSYDENIDLALLKIKPKKNEKFSYITFGNSNEVDVGERVFAIGGPYGYKSSVCSGIISAKSREGVGPNAYNVGEFLQVDAPITYGNSGGPLFDSNGKVIGMSTCGVDHESVNFALSEKTINSVLPKLKSGKNIARGHWGIFITQLEPWDVKALEMDKKEGMKVQMVVKGSPADIAGIKRGDVIIEVNGEKVKDEETQARINRTIMTDTISKIVVNRYGKIITFNKVSAISKKDNEKLIKGEKGLLDYEDKLMSLRLITDELHHRYGLPKEVYGVVISAVKDNNEPMFMLSVGDIIMGINDKEIHSLENYKQVVSELRKKKKDMAMVHIYSPQYNKIVVLGSKL